jgi:hypothetical protein
MNFNRIIFAVILCASTPAMADLADCLSQIENKGGSPASIDAKGDGYIGPYQFSPRTAADSGLCTNGSSISSTIYLANATRTWASFNANCNYQGSVAKQYNIKSYADFTTGPNAAAIQKAMLQVELQQNLSYIQSAYKQYLNTYVNGMLITTDVLEGMIHNQGPTAVTNWLANGKEGTDGNQTTLTGYGSCISQCMTSGSTAGCDLKSTGASVLVNVCNGQSNQ